MRAFCSGGNQTVRGKGNIDKQMRLLLFIHAGAGTQAFCSGGDQTVRGKGGYVGEDNVPRLNVLDLQV